MPGNYHSRERKNPIGCWYKAHILAMTAAGLQGEARAAALAGCERRLERLREALRPPLTPRQRLIASLANAARRRSPAFTPRELRMRMARFPWPDVLAEIGRLKAIGAVREAGITLRGGKPGIRWIFTRPSAVPPKGLDHAAGLLESVEARLGIERLPDGSVYSRREDCAVEGPVRDMALLRLSPSWLRNALPPSTGTPPGARQAPSGSLPVPIGSEAERPPGGVLGHPVAIPGPESPRPHGRRAQEAAVMRRTRGRPRKDARGIPCEATLCRWARAHAEVMALRGDGADGGVRRKAGKALDALCRALGISPHSPAGRDASGSWPGSFLARLAAIEESLGIERRPEGVWSGFARGYVSFPSPARSALLSLPPSALLEDAAAPGHPGPGC
jgi:hypothetical protein